MKMKKEDIMKGLANIRHGKSASTDQTVTSSPSSSTTTHHTAGSKVLPISEANSVCSLTRSHKETETDQEDNGGETTRKAKALYRMKELLRWAAASKAQKGGKYLGRKVLCFRSKGVIKGLPGDLSNDSPKISFRWDVESCSTTTSSAMSASSAPPLMNVGRSDRFEADPRKGSWITTDNEFVVLEL